MKLMQILLILVFVSTYSFCMQNNAAQKNEIKYDVTYDPETPNIRAINANLNEQTIGFIHYSETEKSRKWYIITVEIDEIFRKKGIGTTLLSKCFQDLKELNADKVFWSVVPKNTRCSPEDLIDWYKNRIEKNISPLVAGSYKLRTDGDTEIPLITFTFEKETGEKL